MINRKNLLFFFVVTRGVLLLLSAAYVTILNWSYLLLLLSIPRSIIDLIWWIFNLWFFVSNFFGGYFFYNIGYFCVLKIANLKFQQMNDFNVPFSAGVNDIEADLRRKFV
jgi:hypothetical protein